MSGVARTKLNLKDVKRFNGGIMSKQKIEIWSRKTSADPVLENRLRVKVDRDGVRHVKQYGVGWSPIGYDTLSKNYELMLDDFDENGNPVSADAIAAQNTIDEERERLEKIEDVKVVTDSSMPLSEVRKVEETIDLLTDEEIKN